MVLVNHSRIKFWKGDRAAAVSVYSVVSGDFAFEVGKAAGLRKLLPYSFIRFSCRSRRSLKMRSVHALLGSAETWDCDWTDGALYKKYGITDDEVTFINGMIRPMGESDE